MSRMSRKEVLEQRLDELAEQQDRYQYECTALNSRIQLLGKDRDSAAAGVTECMRQRSVVGDQIRQLIEEDDDATDSGPIVQHIHFDQAVKLYTVQRGTWISLDRDCNSLIFFDHIDGMFSLCYLPNGDIIHLGASTMVFVHDIPGLDKPGYERS